MPRRLRFIPPEGALVEVTTRTVQSRFLLKPSRFLNLVILGVLGRAQRLYDVEIHDFVFLSNHYHLLISVDSALQLARFMGYFNGNLAKEVARLTGWRDKVWSRRYRAILVSNENEAQVARLRYLLSHGVKENLVRRVRDWPGVCSAKARLEGTDMLVGHWYDRTSEFNARRRGEGCGKRANPEIEEVRLSPLPCFDHLDASAGEGIYRKIISEVEEAAREDREMRGEDVLGREGVLSQNDQSHPARSKRSPAPFAHCASRGERRRLWRAYTWFLGAYLDARERLRAGRPAAFPDGSFPPPAPFVDVAPEPG